MSAIREAMQSALAGVLSLSERRHGGVAYNPLSARTSQNPYPLYAALRARDPVHRSRLMNAWLFTRYADVDVILRDQHHFGNDVRKGALTARQQAMMPPPDEITMLFLDPPDHTRLRSLVSKAFTQKAADALEPRIRSILASLLDDIDDLTDFDLMEAVARPLPVVVIAEMLGVPPEDRDRFRTWSFQRVRIIEPTVGTRERDIAESASKALDAYFRSIIQARRAHPRDDLVSALVQAEDEGGRLSERETLNMLRLLLIAGIETTTNLIGNGVLALLRNPAELERLRADPSLIPAAVEELLRFDSPVKVIARRVLADCEVNGFALATRENVMCLIGAANRDPRRIRAPGTARCRARRTLQLSFGRGIHHCLGAPWRAGNAGSLSRCCSSAIRRSACS